MNSVSVIHHPHPILPALAQEFRAHAWRSGETVRELLIRQGLDVHKEIVVVLNDRLLTVVEWDAICPQPTDILNVQAVVSGGGGEDGGGSNALQAVLMIVIAVVAWYAAPAVFGFEAGAAGYTAANAAGMGAYVTAAGAVISVAGNALVSAMFRPSGRALAAANGAESAAANTPNYSLSGGSNSIRPYEPMPVVFGTHRIFPDYGAKPYTEFQGEDQYLYQIFNFGISALSINDLKIGETSLLSYSGVSAHWGDGNGQMPGFPGNVDSDAGAQLIRGAGWVQRTTSPETIQISVDIEGAVFYQGDRGLIGCAATIEAYYAPTGTGAWVPMASRTVVSYTTGYWSLRTTEQIPYQNNSEFDTGVYYYTKIVQHDFASTGHTEAETQIVRAAFDSIEYVDYGAVATHHPAIYGTWYWTDFITADANGWSHPDPIPSYSTAYDLIIGHGASQKSQRNTLRAWVTSGQYDVRIRLTSARSELGEINDGDNRGGYQYSFSVLRSYQQDSANYVGQNRLGLVIKASGQLNGVVQKLSAMATAWCLVWDGSAWRWVPTSNPAWWFLDFALGRKNTNGVKLYGCHLGWENIDVASIKLWALFCDAEGLSCNMILDRNQSAWDTLTTIARCGFASVSYASGTLGVIWDKKNASPVAAFGMSNIIKGSFSVQYVTENLADEIVVSFVDASRDWQQQQVRTTSPGITTPTRTSTVELMGCTNAAMAGKFANYLAAQQVYRKRMITWESDFEGFTCQRGDVVILSHDLTQWGYSGRFVNVAGATLTLERQVPRSGSPEFLMVAFPDGTLTTYTITADTGDQEVITLTAPLVLQDGYGPVDHRWFFSPLPTPGKKVKIVSVRPVSQSRVAIVATDEAAEFYAAWNGTWTQPAQDTLLTNPVPIVVGIAVKEILIVANGGGIINRITASASMLTTYESIFWSYRFSGGSWTNEKTLGSNLVFETSEVGALEISARASNGLFYGAPFNSVVQILGEAAKPADVQNFQASIAGSNIWLTYKPTDEIDVMMGGGGIIIRHASVLTGANWESSAELFRGPAPASGVSLPAMVGTYLAKFIDATGNESVNAALVVNEVSLSLIGLNVVDTLDDAPGWTGAHSLTIYNSVLSAITLSPAGLVGDIPDFGAEPNIGMYGGLSPVGTYALADVIDLGSVETCRISGAISFSCIDVGLTVGEWPDFGAVANVGGVVLGGASAKIQIALSQDGTSYGNWVDLFAGEAQFRKIKARLALESLQANVNVAVTAASVNVDMPDRVEAGNDLPTTAGSYAVTYGREFQVSPALAITAQNMQTGDYYTITSKGTAGFTITFYNAAGTAVARTFDYVAKGY